MDVQDLVNNREDVERAILDGARTAISSDGDALPRFQAVVVARRPLMAEVVYKLVCESSRELCILAAARKLCWVT